MSVSLVVRIGEAAQEIGIAHIRDLGPWEFHPLSLLFIASGSMMISKTLRIPKP